MSDYIDKLAKLGEDATEGPWHRTDHGWTVWAGEGGSADRFVASATAPNDHPDHERGQADSRFIAASRDVWNELVAVVRMSEEEHVWFDHAEREVRLCTCRQFECTERIALDALKAKVEAL